MHFMHVISVLIFEARGKNVLYKINFGKIKNKIEM